MAVHENLMYINTSKLFTVRSDKDLINRLIQIAGVIDADEAKMIMELGADLVGIPLRLGYHKPDISEEKARNIIQEVGMPERFTLITYEDRIEELISLVDYLGVDVVQLHSDLPPETAMKLKDAKPGLTIIKSLIVRDSLPIIMNQSKEYAPAADAFILDSFDKETGATGATGKIHDWEISRELCRSIGKPVILAGGLNERNIGEAIRYVMPAGVDAHTGLEDRDGRKDYNRVSDFIRIARIAFDEY